jgi:hypothetical protein
MFAGGKLENGCRESVRHNLRVACLPIRIRLAFIHTPGSNFRRFRDGEPAEFSVTCYRSTSKDDERALSDSETTIDQAVAKLWNITLAQLAIIDSRLGQFQGTEGED